MSMMQSKSGSGLYRPLAEINVTPLVDVMLVLLIIFMVTAPMLASGMKVNLPQAKQVQPLDPKAPIIISIGKDSSLSLGSDPIERDKLIDAVHEKLGSDISQIIHLRGDKEAAYGDVVAVMDLLAMNGLTHIAIVADPHSKSETTTKPAEPVKPDVSATLSAPTVTTSSVSTSSVNTSVGKAPAPVAPASAAAVVPNTSVTSAPSPPSATINQTPSVSATHAAPQGTAAPVPPVSSDTSRP